MPAVNSIASMMGFHDGTRHTATKAGHSPTCLNGNEEYYVADATRARILVMFYRTLIETRSCFAAFEQKKKCPMLKCFKRFDEPTDLMLHLFDCENLSYGEVECWKCNDDWHEFPNSEKGWAARLDPRKKGKSVRKSTSQLLRKLSGRRGGHHKDFKVASYADDDVVPSLDEELPPGMVEELFSTAAGDPGPMYTPFVDEFQQVEADSGELNELPATQSASSPIYTATRAPEFSYSELLAVSPMSQLDVTDGGMRERSHLPSQTYLVSPRSTVDDGAVTTQTRVTGLTLQTDIFTGSQLCASPDALQPDCECESPPWSPEFVQNHNGHRQSPERTLTGSTLQSSTGEFPNDSSVCANFASFQTTQSSQPPATHPRVWHSATGSGSYEDCSMLSCEAASPSFSGVSGNSDSSVIVSTGFVAETKQQIAELDGSSTKSPQGQPDNERQRITVSVTRKTINDDKEAQDLVCEECNYRPKGLERNRKSHMSRHRKTHKKEVYACTICASPFNRKDNMKKHERKVHPESFGSTQSSKRQAVELYSEPSSETHPKRYRKNYSSFGNLNNIASTHIQSYLR